MNSTNEAKSQLDQLTSFLINAISAQQQHQYVEQLQKAIKHNQNQTKKFHTVNPPSTACTVQRIDPVTRKSVLYRPGNNNYVNLSKEEPRSDSIKSYAGILRNEKERNSSGNSMPPMLGLQQNSVLQQACQLKWMENVKQQQYAWFMKTQQQYKNNSFQPQKPFSNEFSDYYSCDAMSSSDTSSSQFNAMSFSNSPSPTPAQQKKVSTDEEADSEVLNDDDDVLSDLNKQINLICFS